jgi:alpha-tubulin suppressor-like RCC1 family protein
MRTIRRAAAPMLLLAATACQDAPTLPGTGPGAPSAPQATLAEIRCTAARDRGSVECTDQPLSGAARANVITVGGQHRYVRLASSNIAVAGSVMSFDVTVQNLLQRPMGTADGSTAHADGVRVFFATLNGTGGAGEPAVANATGTAPLTGSEAQPFFRYAGADLGAGGILAPGATSAPRRWQIDFATHSSVTFTLYVTTEVPDVDGSFLRFTQVSTGNFHSCGIAADGAYCWGANSEGQLGNGTTTGSTVPVRVTQTASGRFTRISAGGVHTCGITDTGAWCWGSGTSGRLGNGAEAGSSVPVPVNQSASGAFTQVAAGSGSHSCGVSSRGAYCWGSNVEGQLGTGLDASSNVPVPVQQVTSGSGVFTQVAVGQAHTCGVAAGDAYCWGRGSSGQLGNGDGTRRTVPTLVYQFNSGKITHVSVGMETSCGTTDDGAAWCWGGGAWGQLGHGVQTNTGQPVRVTQTESGAFSRVEVYNEHACGISASGAWCWGSGMHGRRGTGATALSSTPQPVAQTASGPFTAIAPGNRQTCGISAVGTFCWGFNDDGRLGTGRTLTETTPAAVAGARG